VQAKFCLKCGTRLEHSCPKCHSGLPASAKFCLESGSRWRLGSRSIALHRKRTPPSTSPKKSLTSKNALEGARKQVTVLFADRKGSMEILADRDPEQARKIRARAGADDGGRARLRGNGEPGDGRWYHGDVRRLPQTHEHHAVRARYAALRMQEMVKHYAEDARCRHGVNVQIRAGLNSGEVAVRAIGSDMHMDYTAVGQTTHLARADGTAGERREHRRDVALTRASACRQ
jgi:class 3 adenylate cyclase